MKKTYLMALAALLVLLGGFGIFRFQKDQKETQYRESHIFIEEAAYPADASALDLRGTAVSLEHYRALRSQLPDCEILWDVPFQGSRVSSDAQVLTVTVLSQEDAALLLECFPLLKTLNAEGCRDYAQLQAIQAARPDMEVSYQVRIGRQDYPLDTEAITVHSGEEAQFLQCWAYLPELKQVHLAEPGAEAEALRALIEAHPEVSFTLEKTVMGTTYDQSLTELDLSGMPLEGVEELEEGLAYFPGLTKVLLSDCGLEDEILAQYRDRVRNHYKVVWTISVGYLKIRTDETTFMPSREGLFVNDSHLTQLRYCEDMIVVDVGHKGVKNVDWIYGMPHLRFLILADTKVCDITPVGSLKELIYLELFKCPGIRDYTPLLNCTALEDLNLAYTGGDVTVLAEMTWLKSLWANCCNATAEEKQLLRDSLPDTLLELDHGWHMGNGWRNRENYYVMRDLLGMPYYDWGSERLDGVQPQEGA